MQDGRLKMQDARLKMQDAHRVCCVTSYMVGWSIRMGESVKPIGNPSLVRRLTAGLHPLHTMLVHNVS
jgi:hypothetical protein